MRQGLVPGVNVDRVDVRAGLQQAMQLGFNGAQELMVIEHALMRWQRGEEEGADKTITSHHIDFTSWRVILARAVYVAGLAAGTQLQAAEAGSSAPAASGALVLQVWTPQKQDWVTVEPQGGEALESTLLRQVMCTSGRLVRVVPAEAAA